jgi:hypothetical protein
MMVALKMRRFLPERCDRPDLRRARLSVIALAFMDEWVYYGFITKVHQASAVNHGVESP